MNDVTDNSRLVTPEQIAEAMQDAWNDFCADTGCVPDAFEIRGPRTTRVYFNADRGNFAEMVTNRLEAIRAR